MATALGMAALLAAIYAANMKDWWGNRWRWWVASGVAMAMAVLMALSQFMS
jgi:4-amino-4-deoxy-L-arabinose transferase-like glycosyltransferase